MVLIIKLLIAFIVSQLATLYFSFLYDGEFVTFGIDLMFGGLIMAISFMYIAFVMHITKN